MKKQQIEWDFHPIANIFPMLEADDLESLASSIGRNGLREPILTYEGKILDGRNRFRACQMAEVAPKFSEYTGDDPLAFVIDKNLERRHMTPSQRAAAAVNILPFYEQAAKERMLSGINQYSPSPKIEQGSNGRASEFVAELFHVSPSYVYEAKAIKKESPEIFEEMAAGLIHMKEAMKAVQEKRRFEQRAEMMKLSEKIKPSNRWHVYHDDMRTWKAPRQYDFIITDPPYPREYLPLWEALAQRAVEWLKPGGLLIAMCGQSYLDEIFALMCKHLKYYWTGSYLTPGQPTPLRQVNVNTTWKPLLMFVNDGYKGKIFGDVFKSDGSDKDFHEWGRSVSGMLDIISKICLPGQYILDPFCGAGATGMAALQNGNLFDGIEIKEENVKISKARLNDASKN